MIKDTFLLEINTRFLCPGLKDTFSVLMIPYRECLKMPFYKKLTPGGSILGLKIVYFIKNYTNVDRYLVHIKRMSQF